MSANVRRKSATRRSANRRQVPQAKSTLEIIDDLLLAPAQMNINREVTRVTTLEVIISQLQKKEIEGNARAGRALLKFEELSKRVAEKQVQLEFIDDEYTQSFSVRSPEKKNG
jgi:hypothetical protein